MTIAFSIEPDERTHKYIQQWRFEYDRKLIKINYPHICVVGPQKMRVNPKRVGPHAGHVLHALKSIKIHVEKPFYQKEGEYFDVYLAIANPEDLLLYRHCLYETALFGSLPDEDMFPHIRIAHQLDEETAETAQLAIQKEKWNASFFLRELAFYHRQGEAPFERKQVYEF
jgi:hypothetical protein